METILHWLFSESLFGMPWLSAFLIGAYLAAQLYVKATPTPDDDEALKKFLQFGGVLAPKDAPRFLKLPWQIITRIAAELETHEEKDDEEVTK